MHYLDIKKIVHSTNSISPPFNLIKPETNECLDVEKTGKQNKPFLSSNSFLGNKLDGDRTGTENK